MERQLLHPYVEGIKAEHHALLRQVKAIRHLLAEPAPPTTDRALHLRDLLTELAAHLRKHFAQEEAGGYMDEAVGIAPHLGPAATELAREHPRLLLQIDDLCERCRRHPDASVCQAFCQEVQALLHDLLLHETREDKLVQQAFNVDLDLEE